MIDMALISIILKLEEEKRACFVRGYSMGRDLPKDAERYGVVHQKRSAGHDGTTCGLAEDPTEAPGSPLLTCPECLWLRFYGGEDEKL